MEGWHRALKNSFGSGKGSGRPGLWRFCMALRAEIALSNKKWDDAIHSRGVIEINRFTEELAGILEAYDQLSTLEYFDLIVEYFHPNYC